jgi:hypothetical protein
MRTHFNHTLGLAGMSTVLDALWVGVPVLTGAFPTPAWSHARADRARLSMPARTALSLVLNSGCDGRQRDDEQKEQEAIAQRKETVVEAKEAVRLRQQHPARKSKSLYSSKTPPPPPPSSADSAQTLHASQPPDQASQSSQSLEASQARATSGPHRINEQPIGVEAELERAYAAEWRALHRAAPRALLAEAGLPFANHPPHSSVVETAADTADTGANSGSSSGSAASEAGSESKSESESASESASESRLQQRWSDLLRARTERHATIAHSDDDFVDRAVRLLASVSSALNASSSSSSSSSPSSSSSTSSSSTPSLVLLPATVSLSALRRCLVRARASTSPLFDMRRFARHLEAAVALAWARLRDGRAPQHLVVAPPPPPPPVGSSRVPRRVS